VRCRAEVENCEFRAPEAELDEYHHKATRTLFVGNLDKSVAKELLRDIFAKFGQIVVSGSVVYVVISAMISSGSNIFGICAIDSI